MKFPILTLTLTLLLSSAGAFASVHWTEMDPDGLLEEQRLTLLDVETAQVKWSAPLLDSGPSCIDGWDDFAKDYPPLVTELMQIANEALAGLENLKTHMTCAGLKTAGEILKNDGLKLDELRSKAYLRFRDEALVNYHRRFTCLFQRYYVDVVDEAFSTADINGDGNYSKGGFELAERAIIRSQSAISQLQETCR